LTAADSPLAIRNAVVETMASTGRIEGATAVIRDGKFAAIGKEVAVPPDATVIDAAGGTLMPGIIDPYFEFAITGATTDSGPRTVVVGGRQITLPGGGGRTGSGYSRVADSFYAYDAGFKPLPRTGLTRLGVVTNGMGQAAIVRVTPKDPQRMMDQPDGFAFVSVTNSSESLDQVRQRLSFAARGGKEAAGGSRPDGFGASATQGAKLWADVVAGNVALFAECANSAAVLHLLKAIEPYRNVKLVLFLGGDSIAETVTAIKDRKATVIVRPGLELLPNTRDRFNPARLLYENGVEVAFTLTGRPPQAGGGGGAGRGLGGEETPSVRTIDSEFPLFPVAIVVKTGMPRIAALESLTKKPALILGIEKTHGSIEPGKAADVLLYSGDPLDPASRLLRTIVDGRVVHAN
jgi:hypothetical protein